MKNFCISHSKDVDGLSAAALVVAARGGTFRLAGYDDIFDELESVPKGIDEFVLCDIGSDAARTAEFVAKLGKLADRCKVTYIDHHNLDEEGKRQIRERGVKLVHNVDECASMLTYQTFASELPEAARNLALFGAVTDYMDSSPSAQKMMERSDRHFILLEASLLSHAVARKGDRRAFVNMLVRQLSKMRPPHEIDSVAKLAVEQLGEAVRLMRIVRRKGRKLSRLAYMNTTQQATGNVAKMLIGAFNTTVGVSFREKSQKGMYEVSTRATSECRVHLGQTLGKLAPQFGGSGGGHRLAAGCRIPKLEMRAFLAALDKVV